MATERDRMMREAAEVSRLALKSLDDGDAIEALFLLEEAADHLRQVVRHPSRPMSRCDTGETADDTPAVAAILWGLKPLWL